MVLPKYAAFQSNNNRKYLRYEHEEGEANKFLKLKGENVVTPYTKFELELSKKHRGLVHVRCCYNNKYWVRWSQNDWWIISGADQTEEDKSKWSCTLFKLIPVAGDPNSFRIFHVQLEQYARLFCSGDPAKPFDSCLYAGYKEPDQKSSLDACTIIDWESLTVMPKHVAFKGDNGKYLSARWIERHEYLQFASDDIGDPSVASTVFTTSDGSVRIKSDKLGKFWRRSPNWIWADSNDTNSNNPDTLFCSVKIGSNVFALRNAGNNNFCKRLTTERKTSCLNAAISTISREARMVVEELVLSRQIYNVDFHLTDARIYGQRALTMASGVAINRTSEKNATKLNLAYTETKKSTWGSSVTVKLGVKTTIQTGIPCIADGKVEVSEELSATYNWGETTETTTKVELVCDAAVPPMSKVTVSLLATKGSCDVPFSYYQHETLANGQRVTYKMDDGVYTGVNCFNFKYETKEEKL